MIESLHELSDEIKSKHGKLYFFYGDTIDYTSYSKYRDNLINIMTQHHLINIMKHLKKNIFDK